jgi:hypothetical protein
MFVYVTFGQLSADMVRGTNRSRSERAATRLIVGDLQNLMKWRLRRASGVAPVPPSHGIDGERRTLDAKY